ncbi:hypothetical protein FB451DRAFT_1369735 [Mycena latifolia]|nr:hypothetical protein FB451DRAFT_1369735 [Mycena latifolia]
MLPKMHVLRAKCATPESMTAFHKDEYMNFLARVTPEMQEELTHREPAAAPARDSDDSELWSSDDGASGARRKRMSILTNHYTDVRAGKRRFFRNAARWDEGLERVALALGPRGGVMEHGGPSKRETGGEDADETTGCGWGRGGWGRGRGRLGYGGLRRLLVAPPQRAPHTARAPTSVLRALRIAAQPAQRDAASRAAYLTPADDATAPAPRPNPAASRRVRDALSRRVQDGALLHLARRRGRPLECASRVSFVIYPPSPPPTSHLPLTPSYAYVLLSTTLLLPPTLPRLPMYLCPYLPTSIHYPYTQYVPVDPSVPLPLHLRLRASD